MSTSGDTTTATDNNVARSSAEEFLREVALRIGMEESLVVDEICKNLAKEYIIHEWQLSALDSFQWQTLGAPIGLAAAIRKITNSKTSSEFMDNSTAATPEYPSMLTSSSRTSIDEASSSSLRMSKRKTVAGSVFNSAPRASVFGALRSTGGKTRGLAETPPIQSEAPKKEFGDIEEQPEEGDDDEEHEKNAGVDKEEDCCIQAPKCMASFRKSLCEYPHHKYLGRSFPMTSLFQQALIHSKSGAELKAHTVFVMELSVLTSALILGAAVEMWGAFPMEYVSDAPDDVSIPYVPRALALVYHFLSCASLIIQLLCTSGWIWSLHATAAISPEKFHKFLVQTRYPFSYFTVFSEFGQTIFVANIAILCGALVAATTTNQIVRELGYYVPIIVLFLGCKLTHNLTSYIGRVAYHGLLLMDTDAETVMNKEEEGDSSICKDRGCAVQAEQDITKYFRRHKILCEERVLDIYHSATIKSYEDPVMGGTSMFDFIFPSSKPPPSSETRAPKQNDQQEHHAQQKNK